MEIKIGVHNTPREIVFDSDAQAEYAECRLKARFLTGLQSLEGRSTYFQDAWALAGDGSLGYTWDPANPFAAPLHLHPKRVDYVLVGDHFPFNAPSAPGAAPAALAC